MIGELHFPWLALTTLLPLVGAAVVWRMSDLNAARRWSIGFSAAALACSLAAWADFETLNVPLAHDPGEIFTRLAGRELFTLDELSALLVPLAALLYLLTAVATLRSKMPRYSFSANLISEAILLATFNCREPWGIVALLVLGTLPPVWELYARHRPMRVYLFHMGLFSLLLLAGWGLVEWERTLGGDGKSHSLWPLVPLLLAVFIRSGIAPFHCWVTDLFEHATFGTALAFVTPMVGAYAAVRLILPTAPLEVLHAMGIVSLLTAVYAAGMALVQREARRFFCYVFISHSALVLVGLETGTPAGVTGALVVWLSLGISLAGFGLTLRALESRHGRLSLVAYHGVYGHTPLLAICFMLTGMASVGFPGTFGFLGSELLIDGVIHTYPIVGLGVTLAAALNGIAVVQAYFKLFTGTKHVSSVPLGVCFREQVAVLTLIALIVGGGAWPQPGMLSRHNAAKEILSGRPSELVVEEHTVAKNESGKLENNLPR